jgi:hypothetical protein
MNTNPKEAQMDACVDITGRGSLAIGGVAAATSWLLKVILSLNDVFHFRREIKYGVISAVLQYICCAEEAAKY